MGDYFEWLGHLLCVSTVLFCRKWKGHILTSCSISQLIYGIGVGGEYPMTSTTAMESKNISNSQTDDKLHRGRNVVLAFLMQGESILGWVFMVR